MDFVEMFSKNMYRVKCSTSEQMKNVCDFMHSLGFDYVGKYNSADSLSLAAMPGFPYCGCTLNDDHITAYSSGGDFFEDFDTFCQYFSTEDYEIDADSLGELF